MTMRRFFGLVVLLFSLIYSGCVMVVRPNKDKCSNKHRSTEKCKPCKEKEKEKEKELKSIDEKGICETDDIKSPAPWGTVNCCHKG